MELLAIGRQRSSRCPYILSLVRDSFHRGRVVVSICHAGLGAHLCRHHRGQARNLLLLDKGDLKNAGAEYIDGRGRQGWESDHVAATIRSTRLLPGGYRGFGQGASTHLSQRTPRVNAILGAVWQ